MMNKTMFLAGSFLLAAVLVLAACNGKTQSQSGGGNAAGDARQVVNAVKKAAGTALDGLRAAVDTRLTEMADEGLILPEDEVTETDADRIGGWIARGKTNLKLTGPVTEAQLQAIAAAMDGAGETNEKQLFRLDLSATGLTALPDYCFFLSGFYNCYLGEVVLPEGIKRIGRNAFYGQRNLYAINLPNSLEYIGNSAFDEIWLPKVVVPVKLDLVGKATNWYGYISGGPPSQSGFLGPYGGKETTYVFQDGVTAMNMAMFDVDPDVYNSSDKNTVKYVLPSTLKSFFVFVEGWAKLSGITELYCYAPTPPVYQPPADHARVNYGFFQFSEANTQLCLDSVKTVYVPAGSEKAYEDAWFNYTGAEFKPLPAALSTIDKWY
jgi:hypothetical protein